MVPVVCVRSGPQRTSRSNTAAIRDTIRLTFISSSAPSVRDYCLVYPLETPDQGPVQSSLLAEFVTDGAGDRCPVCLMAVHASLHLHLQYGPNLFLRPRV